MINTSISSCLKSIAGKPLNVLSFIVVSVSPIKLRALNDEKLLIGQNSIVIPERLTDYPIKVNIMIGNKKYVSETTVNAGLKVDDIVTAIAYNNEQRYIIIDREGG